MDLKRMSSINNIIGTYLLNLYNTKINEFIFTCYL